MNFYGTPFLEAAGAGQRRVEFACRAGRIRGRSVEMRAVGASGRVRGRSSKRRPAAGGVCLPGGGYTRSERRGVHAIGAAGRACGPAAGGVHLPDEARTRAGDRWHQTTSHGAARGAGRQAFARMADANRIADTAEGERLNVPGLGTLINVACIVGGGLVGLLASSLVTRRLQEALMRSCGVCVMFVGLAGALEKMLVATASASGTVTLASTGSMMLVASMAIGTVAGEAADIDGRFEGLGVWLRDKTGSTGDASFVDGFVTASLTVCIGAMAIVGSIQDGLSGDWSTLALKGVMDAIIVCAMAASMGKGCVFSALPVAVFQGSITALATLLQPLMTEAALANLSLVGSVLIFCVGVNLIWPRTFKVANMLPAVVVAVALAFF